MTLIVGHFARLHGTWFGDLSVDDCIGLDTRGAQAINGDTGGTWAPYEQIVISGSTYGLTVSGPTVVFGAGSFLQTQPSGSPHFTMNEGFPYLVNAHEGQTRELTTSLVGSVPTVLPGLAIAPPVTPSGAFGGGIQTGAPAFAVEAGDDTQVAQGTVTNLAVAFRCELRVHDGATLSSAAVNFSVSQPHSSVPTLPRGRVLRVDSSGNVVALTSAASGADGSGYVSPPTPTSGTAWYNLGAGQTWDIPCDQNNVVDITEYVYVLEFTEEQNSTTVDLLAPVVAATTATDGNITPYGVGETIDGQTTLDGSRYLLTEQADARQNGPWVAHATTVWSRPDDWSIGSSVDANTTLYVESGKVNGDQYLQLDSGALTAGGYPTWAPDRTYTVGQIVSPTTSLGYAYACLVAGTSAGSDPTATWPTNVGAQITDGTIFPTWTASASHSVGDVVTATTPNGWTYRCTTAGTSSGTDPTTSWPRQVGATVVDGSVTWTAYQGGPVTWSAVKDPSGLASFAAYSAVGNIWTSATCTFTGITSLSFQ